jgi:hypothetical protein
VLEILVLTTGAMPLKKAALLTRRSRRATCNLTDTLTGSGYPPVRAALRGVNPACDNLLINCKQMTIVSKVSGSIRSGAAAMDEGREAKDH